MCELEDDGIHICNYVPHVKTRQEAQRLTNPKYGRWVYMVRGGKRERYPTWIGGDDETTMEAVAKYSTSIFFLAEVGDTGEDIRWFDGLPGPDWNCDIDTMEGLMSGG